MNIINKKPIVIYLACLCFLVFTGSVYPIDINNVIAYPVPFNPKVHKNLNIREKPGHIVGPVDKVKIDIFDINGDRVLVKEYSTLNVLWNGRNDKGRLVGPGLYIIKITLEYSPSGEYRQKIIRILVNG